MGYEAWRKVHYVTAMLYVGACWGHWSSLSCWMIASLTVWLVDRVVRLVRTGLLHYQYVPGGKKMGFGTVEARCKVFDDSENGDVVRLDFKHNHGAWDVGQHFYLTFAEGGIWQSHPFTPSSMPIVDGWQEHTYIFRAKSGETKRLAELLKRKKAAANRVVTTPVILAGPYGKGEMENMKSASDVNILCVAGGSGVTFVLPTLTSLISEPALGQCERKLELIWAIRRKADMQWIQSELDTLYEASKKIDLRIRILVTRDGDEKNITAQAEGDGKVGFVKFEEDKLSSSSQSSSTKEIHSAPRYSSFSVQQATHAAEPLPETRHPDLDSLIHEFLLSTVRGPTCVFASGPGEMISDLREIIAACNSGSKVMKGDERFDVRLIYDNRLEW